MSDDSDVQVKFGAQIEGLLAGVNDAKDAISGLTEPIGGIVDAFQSIGEAAVAGFALDRVYEYEKGLAELGEQIERTSKMTGLSSDEVQQFGFAVRETGGDSDTAAQALLRFEANLAKAQAGTGPAAAAYEKLGISLKNADGTYKNISQILPEVADRFAQTADGATKVEYATAIGSRGFAQLIPLLDQGSAGLQKLNEILDSTNSKLSSDQVDALAASKRASIEADAAWKGFYQTIGSTAFFDKVNQDMKDLAGAATEVAKAIQQADKAFQDFISDSADRIPTETEKFIAAANQFKAKMAGDTSIYGPPAPAPKPALAPLDTSVGSDDGGKDTRDQEAKEATNTQIALSKLAFAQIAQDQDALVAQFKETEAQKVDALKAATELQYQTEQGLLDKEAAGYSQDSLAFQQVQDKKALLAAQFTLEIAKLNDDLAAAQKRQYEQELAPWKQLMGDMGGAFDTMINGILQGTQTWKQALGKSFDDLLIKFTEVITKMVAEYAVFEATSGSGILGFGTTNPFAALSGVGGAGQTAVVTANTTAVSALTTAMVANTTALGADTAAEGGAAATGGGGFFSSLLSLIPSFDTGTNFAPGGLSLLHPGEIVIPASQSAALRSGTASIGGASAGVSGGQFNFTIQAIDTQTGMSFLQSNAGNIATIIAGQIRNGHNGLVNAVKN